MLVSCGIHFKKSIYCAQSFLIWLDEILLGLYIVFVLYGFLFNNHVLANVNVTIKKK